jgi:hypothetical protein
LTESWEGLDDSVLEVRLQFWRAMQPKVLKHSEVWEDSSPLRDQAQAGLSSAMRCDSGDIGTIEEYLASVGLQ